jgi:hypothetical protein
LALPEQKKRDGVREGKKMNKEREKGFKTRAYHHHTFLRGVENCLNTYGFSGRTKEEEKKKC